MIARELRVTEKDAPIAVSPKMREVLQSADDVSGASTTVLLLGESGTGKEVLARYIHRRSSRALGPWVAVNCAAIPAELLESELFGHERGAFTGAIDRHAGRLEQAHKGTLLLDEISEMPLALQAKLLRVLQEREIDRVGGLKPVPVDVRIIATSNRDLEQMVANGQFRTDLYYRLNVFPIELPPLRDRPDDIPALAEHLMNEIACDRDVPRLSERALEVLKEQRFPGNVRELRNVLERALVRCHGAVLDGTDLQLRTVMLARVPQEVSPPTFGDGFFSAGAPIDLAHLERLAITEALRRVSGNRTHAAKMLGIGLRTLRNKLREYREANISVEPITLSDRQDLPSQVSSPVSLEQARKSHSNRTQEEAS